MPHPRPYSVAWHVTPACNVGIILKTGLQPKIGDRSKSAGETDPSIYCFRCPEDLFDAMMNWAGNLFDDDEPLALLAVQLFEEEKEEAKAGAAGYEWTVKTIIPPERVRCVFKDIDRLTEIADLHQWAQAQRETWARTTTSPPKPKQKKGP